MKIEPKISVGIIEAAELSFILHSQYLFNGAVVDGEQKVCFQNEKVLCNGIEYDEMLFLPVTDGASFTIKEVVIGINFHWERKEDQRFEGGLKIIVSNQNIVAINTISVESYLTSVISSEMSATASLQLLKAHAVISRSWLLAQIEKNKKLQTKNEKYSTFIETDEELIRWYDREDHDLFDVCADDHCQRYQGITRASASLEKVKQAISETRGEVLLWHDEICDARFSKCCGGLVEEFQNCWEDIKYPYLARLYDNDACSCDVDLTDEPNAQEWIRTRPDAFCNTDDKAILSQVLNNYDQETTDFYRWTVSYSTDELSTLVKKRSGIDFGIIQDLIPIERGVSGRLIKLKVVGSKKTLIVGKELEIRRILSLSHLYSSAFVIDKHEDHFKLIGAGWGHGVGLCQIGAAVMGERGYNYEKILLHYYVGAEIKKLY